MAKKKKTKVEQEEITPEQALAIVRQDQDDVAARRAKLERDVSFVRKGPIEQFHLLHDPKGEVVVKDGHCYLPDGSHRENLAHGAMWAADRMKPIEVAFHRLVWAKHRYEQARERYYNRRDFLVEGARAAQAAPFQVPEADLFPDAAVQELIALERAALPFRALFKRAERIYEALKDGANPKIRQQKERDDLMRAKHKAIADSVVEHSLNREI